MSRSQGGPSLDRAGGAVVPQVLRDLGQPTLPRAAVKFLACVALTRRPEGRFDLIPSRYNVLLRCLVNPNLSTSRRVGRPPGIRANSLTIKKTTPPLVGPVEDMRLGRAGGAVVPQVLPDLASVVTIRPVAWAVGQFSATCHIKRC